MWANLTTITLGDYNYQIIPQEINSPQIQFIFTDFLQPIYQANYRDIIVIAREFGDGCTESCGIIYPQHPQMIFQLNPLPLGYSEFKLKLKKIPRRGYGLSLNTQINYWLP
jgi:hypothetical protein